MSTPEIWLESAKGLLKVVIREQGFTQVQIQEELGWGRSYISQAINEGKELRFEVVLQILFAIGMEPQVFFTRLAREIDPEALEAAGSLPAKDPEVVQLRRAVAGLASLLIECCAVPANRVEKAMGRKLPVAVASNGR